MIHLYGKRVWLDADIPAKAREWRNDAAIRQWCREYTTISPTRHQYWLDRIEKDPSIKMFGVYSMDRQTFVGVCGLTSINHVNQSAEFSLYIAPEFQALGLGREALETLCDHGFRAFNLNRIWGEVFDGNPAMGTFEAVGFKHEARLRESYFRDGKFIDSHIISVLRGEWCSRKFSSPS